MHEPPPSAMITSQPCSTYRSYAAWISWSFGFGVTSHHTTGLEARVAEVAEQLVDPAGLDDAGVGDDQRPPGTEPGRGEAGLAERPDPEHDLRGVELDQRGCGRGHRLGG